MSRLLVAISVVVLGVGAAIGYSRLASANIPPPYTAEDADVNVDGVVNPGDQAIVASKVGKLVTTTTRPVAEQNLDGSGNIKVHEQGTVNVNTQPSAGTTTTIFDADVDTSATFYTSFANVEQCDVRMVLLVNHPVPSAFDNHIAFVPSPDGVAGYGVPPDLSYFGSTNGLDGNTGWVSSGFSTAYLDVTGHNVGPFMQFGLRNGGSAQHVTIKLYCR